MLRRFSTCFALLIFALAFSIPIDARGTAPPDVASVERASQPLLVIANLFLPRAAIAQATASASAQTIADNPTPILDSGAGPVDSTPASERVPDKSSHSRAIVYSSVAAIGVLAATAFLLSRRTRSNGGGATGSSSGQRRTAS